MNNFDFKDFLLWILGGVLITGMIAISMIVMG